MVTETKELLGIEDPAELVRRWAATAPYGGRSEIARRLGISRQAISVAIRSARLGRSTNLVRKMAEELGAAIAADDAISNEIVHVPYPRPINDLCREICERTGLPRDKVLENLRENFGTMRNIWAPGEFVFADWSTKSFRPLASGHRDADE